MFAGFWGGRGACVEGECYLVVGLDIEFDFFAGEGADSAVRC